MIALVLWWDYGLVSEIEGYGFGIRVVRGLERGLLGVQGIRSIGGSLCRGGL